MGPRRLLCSQLQGLLGDWQGFQEPCKRGCSGRHGDPLVFLLLGHVTLDGDLRLSLASVSLEQRHLASLTSLAPSSLAKIL